MSTISCTRVYVHRPPTAWGFLASSLHHSQGMKELWKTGSHLSCTVNEKNNVHYLCLTDSSQQQLLICQEPGVCRRSGWISSRGHMQQCPCEAVLPSPEHTVVYSTGRRIQCQWVKNAMNVNMRVCFLSSILNLHPSVSEAMSNLMMMPSCTITRL